MKKARRQSSPPKPALRRMRAKATAAVSPAVRPQMLKRGEKLIRNKRYPGRQLIKKLAGLLASQFLAERN